MFFINSLDIKDNKRTITRILTLSSRQNSHISWVKYIYSSYRSMTDNMIDDHGKCHST